MSQTISPSRCSYYSITKWPRNIDPFNTSIEIYLAQESNSASFYTGKISVKRLPIEFVTDLDPSKRMNLACSVLGENPKFIDFELLFFDATGKPNSFFSPSTRAESLNDTDVGSLNGDQLVSSHGAEVAVERVSETKAYSNHIKNLNLKLENVLSGKLFRLKIFH